MADLIDTTRQAHSQRKPPQYPRPWEGEHKDRSKPPTVSQDRIMKELRERGH